MGSCALLCPLCEGHAFPDLAHLLEAVLQILSKKVECPSCNTEVAGLPSLVQHITQFHVDRKDNLDQLLDDFNEFVSNGDNGDNTSFANVKHSNDINMSDDFNQSTCFIKADFGKPPSVMMTPSTSSPSSMTAPPSTPSSPSSPSSIDISSSQASLLLSQAPPLPTIKSALLASRDKNVKNKLKVPRWDGREVECDQCGWMFDNANFLHLHKVLMHSRRRQGKRLQCLEEFTCRSCGPAEKVSFKMFDAYVEHLKLVHNDHRHVCSYCAKAFKLKGSLLVHQRVMHQPCPQGDQQKGPKRTIKHEVIKEEEQEESSNLMQSLEEDTKPLLQPSSSVGFPQLRPPPQQMHGILQASQLIQQPVQMHQPLPIHQQVQPLQPIRAKQMVHHQVQRAHQPIRTKYQPIQNVPQQNSSPVFCNLCNMNFSCQTDLLVHTASLHSKFEQRDISNTNNSVESTVTNHHKLPPKINNTNRELEKGEICTPDNEAGSLPQVKQDNDNLSCNICGKTFLVPSHLSVHSRVHEVKQWDCTTCGKKFTTKYFLKKHRRLHTGETPYSCTICGRTFTFQQSYHKHMLYHTDEKPYSCTHCGRAFKELSTLQNHERIHSGERPFVCETCGKSFRQRVSYLVHRRIHTGVLPYNCKDCGKKFRYKVTQRTHKCLGRPNESQPGDNETTQPRPLSEDTALLPQVPSPHSTEPPPFLPHSDLYQYRQPTSPTTQYQYPPHPSPIDQCTYPPPPPEITEAFPDIPHEVKQNLLKFRRAQGRRQLSQRLHNILEKSRQSRQASQSPHLPPQSPLLPPGMAPLSELQHLSLNELPPGAIDGAPHGGVETGEQQGDGSKTTDIPDVNLDELMNSYIDDVGKGEQNAMSHQAWDKASQNNIIKPQDNDPFNRAVIDFDISALSFDHTHKP